MTVQLLAATGGPLKKPVPKVQSLFSTTLYNGNAGAQTLNTGVDLTKGGMVMFKRRTSGTNFSLYDTLRGLYQLNPNLAGAATLGETLTLGNGTIGMNNTTAGMNASGITYAAWAFAKAPKFFDVVQYTGNGSTQEIAHSLGVKPGMIWIKRTDATSNWAVWHRGIDENAVVGLSLNSTAARSTIISAVSPATATTFTPDYVVDSGGGSQNAAGATYVAYLFAHDTSAEGNIICGSFTGNGSATGNIIDCGWQPQFILMKNASTTGSWSLIDTARGMGADLADDASIPISTAAETTITVLTPIPRGFRMDTTASAYNGNGNTILYMAIRRPGQAVPTSGLDVFAAVTAAGTGTSYELDLPFAPDMIYSANRYVSASKVVHDRIRSWRTLATDGDQAETSANTNAHIMNFNARGVRLGSSANTNGNGQSHIHYAFARAKGFFDIVYYVGSGTAIWNPHGLGAVPELMLIKNRNSTYGWVVYHKDLNSPTLTPLQLNNTMGVNSTVNGFTAAPDSGYFKLTSDPSVNFNGYQFVGYLFASVPGVSKVGSYIGTGDGGAGQVIDCGFTNGARFVLTRRADATGGHWNVFDSTRGIVSGNDPAGLFSVGDPEYSSNVIDPDPSGFKVIYMNTLGIKYIYLAIA